MNDKELADKIVALGVGELDDIGDYVVTGTWDSDGEPCIDEVFVRDWRVAGALMEKNEGNLEAIFALNSLDYLPKDEALPRAITEACVKRLEALT